MGPPYEVAPPSTEDDNAPAEMDRWKIILAALLPLLGLALVAAFVCWYRQYRHKAKRNSELERIGTMLDDFRTKTSDVEALSHELQAGVDRVRKLETELKVSTANLKQTHASAGVNKGGRSLSISCPSPASSQLVPLTPTASSPAVRNEAPVGSHRLSTSGTLPHSALGLEYLPRSNTGSDSSTSAVSHERYMSYKAPSTIPEESSAGVSSPFDTPGRDNSPLLQNPDGSYRFLRVINEREAPQDEPAVGSGDILTHLSPLRTNPSHPDLVPQPLAVVKRNSTLHAPSCGGAVIARVRRSYSDATAGRGLIRAKEDPELSSPTPMARGQIQAEAKIRVHARSDTPPPVPAISAIPKPPPTTLIRERRESGGHQQSSTNSFSFSTTRRLAKIKGIAEHHDVTKKKHSSLPVRPRPLPSPSKALASRIPRLSASPKRKSASAQRPVSTATRQGESAMMPSSPTQYRGRTFSKIFPPLSSSPQKKQKASQGYPSSQCLPAVDQYDEDGNRTRDDAESEIVGDPLGRAALLREMSETLRCRESSDLS